MYMRTLSVRRRMLAGQAVLTGPVRAATVASCFLSDGTMQKMYWLAIRRGTVTVSAYSGTSCQRVKAFVMHLLLAAYQIQFYLFDGFFVLESPPQGDR